MTSCTTRLSTLGDRKRGLKPTGRIFVYDFSELIAIHLWKVFTVDELLELRVGPRGRGQSERIISRPGVYSRNVETV